MKPDTLFYFVRGVSRAVRRGDLFPAAGRVQAAEAPEGSGTLEVSGEGAELHRLHLTQHRIRLGLPAPIRVLHVSDTHVRAPDADLDRLCALLSRQRPDLIALTGDLIAHGWTDAALDRLLDSLPAAPLGRYAVIGNWEYWAGAPVPVWAQRLARHGIAFLHNRGLPLPAAGLHLLGTDDALAGTPDLPAAFAGRDPAAPALALTHSPSPFPALAAAGADLTLAGHTHGGQIRLPLTGPFFLPRGSGAYPWGWYRQEQQGRTSHLFVSRGTGWSVGPVRWRAPPEIAVIEIG